MILLGERQDPRGHTLAEVESLRFRTVPIFQEAAHCSDVFDTLGDHAHVQATFPRWMTAVTMLIVRLIDIARSNER